MPAKSAPAVPPEAIAAVGQHTVSKLSERAVGRLTYQTGVGTSGTVYFTITDNEGGGYFSREPVALAKIETVLAEPLATGASFATCLLRRAFVNRSNNNACFLAAVLRHAGLVKPADPPHLHRCAGDWETWADNQRHRLAKQGSTAAQEAPGPMPEAPMAIEDEEAPEPVAQDAEGPTGPDEVEEPIQEALALAEDDPSGTPGEDLDAEAPPPDRHPGRAARGTGSRRHADR